MNKADFPVDFIEETLNKVTKSTIILNSNAQSKSKYQLEDELKIWQFQAQPKGYQWVELSDPQWKVLDLHLNHGLKAKEIS